MKAVDLPLEVMRGGASAESARGLLQAASVVEERIGGAHRGEEGRDGSRHALELLKDNEGIDQRMGLGIDASQVRIGGFVEAIGDKGREVAAAPKALGVGDLQVAAGENDRRRLRVVLREVAGPILI